jgi:hypothetical protein
MPFGKASPYMDAEEAADASTWLAFALGDLEAARARPGHRQRPRIVAFNAQQAAEKALGRVDAATSVGQNWCDVSIRFARSATRHGISESRARHVVETCPQPLYSDDPEDQDLVIFLGPDQHGVPLEVMGIELAGGDLHVVHAMKLRSKYRHDYDRVMAWRDH